jgi:hypothetical protein
VAGTGFSGVAAGAGSGASAGDAGLVSAADGVPCLDTGIILPHFAHLISGGMILPNPVLICSLAPQPAHSTVMLFMVDLRSSGLPLVFDPFVRRGFRRWNTGRSRKAR